MRQYAVAPIHTSGVAKPPVEPPKILRKTDHGNREDG
jgi:hypothetical protein